MMTKAEILKLVDEALEPLIDTREPVAATSDRIAKAAYTLGMLKGRLEADDPGRLSQQDVSLLASEAGKSQVVREWLGKVFATLRPFAQEDSPGPGEWVPSKGGMVWKKAEATAST